MKIKQQAVDNFLNRKLETFEWAKKCTHEELDEALSDLKPKPKLPKEMLRHQKVCFYIGVCVPEFLYFLDMGLGKTMISLQLLDWHRRAGNLKQGLVMVPNAPNMDNWEEEAEKWTPNLNVMAMHGTTADRWEEIYDDDVHVFVINYQGLVAMLSTDAKNDKKSKKDKGWVTDDKKLRLVQKRVNALIVDESQLVANPQSLYYKVANKIAKDCDIRHALTGTPFNRDPQALWSQFFTVDRGKTLGPTQGIFRAAFCREERNPFSGWPVYKFEKKKKAKLHKVIQHRSIWYTADECTDVPKRRYIRRRVPFPSENWQYYEELQNKMREARDRKARDNVFLRMRQVCSGFLSFKGNDDSKVDIVFGSNPKLDQLLEMIDEVPVGHKIVVYHEFIFSGNIISKELKKRKVGHRMLNGQIKNARQQLEQFRKDNTNKYPVLIANLASGAAGLNLQMANYTFYYESPPSSLVRRQSEKRTDRTGQKHRTVFFGDLVTKNSVEETILQFHKEGRNLHEAIVKGKVTP